jgi:hypothetical protein
MQHWNTGGTTPDSRRVYRSLQTGIAVMAHGFGGNAGDVNGKKEDNENGRFLGDM